MDIPTADRPKKKLRIFTFQELVSETLIIYRANFAKIIVLLLIASIPGIVASLWSTNYLAQVAATSGIDLTNPQIASSLTQAQITGLFGALVRPFLVILLISLIVGLFQTVVINSVVTYLTSETYLGRSATFGQAVAAVQSRFGTLFGGVLLYGTLLIGISFALLFVLFLCGIGFGIIAYVALVGQAFLVPVLVLERTDVRRGLRRAWFLAKRRLWPVVGVTVLVAIISSLLSWFIGLIPSTLVIIVVVGVVGVLLAPLTSIAMTLLYYDARVRYEDLETALNAASTPEPVPADVASPAPYGPLMEGTDFTNLAILTAAVFVLALVLVAVQFASGGAVQRF